MSASTKMAYTKADLENDLRSISDVGFKALDDLEREFNNINAWLDGVEDLINNGNVTSGHHLPKTPAKKRGVLGTISESVSNISIQESPEIQKNKRFSKKKGRQTRTKRKQGQSTDIEEREENTDDSLLKRRRTLPNDDLSSALPAPINAERTAENASVSSEVLVPPGSSPEENQRRTRSQAERQSHVKETTFVVPKAAEKSKSIEAPILKTPSPVRVSDDSSDDVFKSPLPLAEPSIASVEASPDILEVKSQQRMTRTKTRALEKAKHVEKDEPTAQASPKKKSDTGYTSGQDSDDYTLASSGSSLKVPASSSLKQKFGTPNGKTYCPSLVQLGTPTVSNLLTSVHSFIAKPAPASVKKVREDDYLQKLNQKTAEAIKKRDELMKAQTEEKMRKRQEKAMKVNAAREALEKERAERLRLQQEQEELKRKEELAKRRKLHQQKVAEAARAAKRQQDEEQKRLADEKKKKQEEAERLRKEEAERERLRKEAEERERLRREEAERERLRREEAERERLRREAEERERLRKEKEERERLRKEEAERERLRKEKEERLRKEAEKAAALKAAKASKLLNETYVKPSSYEMTPLPADRQPLPAKSSEDYGIDDARCDDSSDDETNPKKKVPTWAEPKQRARSLMLQCDYMQSLARIFFESKKTTPDLGKMFKSIDKRLLIRKSSAVWNTPPIKFNKDL